MFTTKLALVATMLMFLLCLPILAQRKTLYYEPCETRISMVPNDVLSGIDNKVYNSIVNLGRVNVVVADSKGPKANRAELIMKSYIEKYDEKRIRGKKVEDLDRYETTLTAVVYLFDAKTNSNLGKVTCSSTGSSLIKRPQMPRSNRYYREEENRLYDEAVANSMEKVVSNAYVFVERIIDENVKINVDISAITQIKNDGVKMVVINKGINSGISKGQRFIVSVEEMTGEYPVITEIAEIRVKNQPTENSAICKVVKGDDKLKKALDSHQKLIIVSRTAKFFD